MMMMFVLLLTISLIEVNVVLSYEMGRDNNTVCPEKHSCRSSNNNRAEIYRYCKCDGLCETYDDCCDDYARSGSRPNLSNNNTFNLSRDVFSCKRLFDSSNHYTVDRCPRGWPQGHVKTSCSSGGSNSGNTIARVPVVGRQSSILYRNVYCAVCNGEHDVVFSKGRVESHSAALGDLRLNSMEFLSPQGCNLRTCINAIRTCNSSYSNREVKRRCTEPSQSNSFVNSGRGQYFSFIDLVLWDTTFYRNADCARCNFVNEPKQMCNYEDTGRRYPASVPPYTMLIDFSSNTIETTDNGNGRKNRNRFRCKRGRVYDPITKICRLVFT